MKKYKQLEYILKKKTKDKTHQSFIDCKTIGKNVYTYKIILIKLMTENNL